MEVRVGTPEALRVEQCLLDGEDVTQRCFCADDASGVVGLWVLDDRGRLTPVQETRHGKVEIKMRVVGA